VSAVQEKRIQEYSEIINQLPSFKSDLNTMADGFDVARQNSLGDVTVYYSSGSKQDVPAEEANPESANLDNFYSFGSVFMKMVAEPIVKSKQYEEVQVIFYPFNKCAGAVHSLPISSFPIESSRLRQAITDAAKKSPELSARDIIAILKNKFTGFDAARAYLRSGFYNQKKEDGTIEEKEEISIKVGRKVNTIKSVNKQKSFEERLFRAGIFEKKFVRPNVEVFVEASKMLDPDGNTILDPTTGQTKTIIKIHVYDSSCDPHSTLSEIITAAKDNELGVIQTAVANFNASVKGDLTRPTVNDAAQKYQVNRIIEVAREAGILEAVNIASLKVVTPEQQKELDGSVFYRVKGNYESVKRLVSAGMPTITYGSSNSAITNASVTTGGSAVSNVMLMRAFNSPAEVAAENIDTGVPMQVLPAQLSLSTLGCPLFYPMQRFFVDFGTGTSLDSTYYVLSVDTTIGKDGFKTDLKMSYSSGYPTYTSLNKQLAMMAANYAEVARPLSGVELIAVEETKGEKPDSTNIDRIKQEDLNEYKTAYTEQLQKGLDSIAKQRKDLENEINASKAKAAELAEKAKRKAAAIIPESEKLKIKELLKEAEKKREKLASLAEQANDIISVNRQVYEAVNRSTFGPDDIKNIQDSINSALQSVN
jgi:hypothetical protein